METIKQYVRTPENHKIMINIPSHVQKNDLVEIILVLNKKQNSFRAKIDELKMINKDKYFLDDLKTVQDDFENIDLTEWE